MANNANDDAVLEYFAQTGFRLPIELSDGMLRFTGTMVPVELFLLYAIGHGAGAGGSGIRDFLADFPTVTERQIWAFVQMLEGWTERTSRSSGSTP